MWVFNISYVQIYIFIGNYKKRGNAISQILCYTKMIIYNELLYNLSIIQKDYFLILNNPNVSMLNTQL